MKKPLRVYEKNYANLMKFMSKKNVGIPAFQRGFVWKDKQVVKLVDSLLSQYPIGAFIIWETNQDIGMRDTSCNFLSGKKKKYLIIDGQQRMFSLYYLNDQSKFSRNKQQFYEIYAGRQKKPIEFEKYSLKKHGRKYLLEKGGNDSYFDTKLFNRLLTKNYLFPLIFIYTNNLETAKKIFSRVNELGTKLSTEDIFISKLWGKSLDLGRVLKERRAKLNKDSKNIFSKLDRIVYFHVFSLMLHLRDDTKKEMGLSDTLDISITTLNKIADRLSKVKTKRKKRYHDIFISCLDAIQEALSFLRKDLKIFCLEDIPSQTLVTVLSVFFCFKNRPNRLQKKELLKWCWRSSFGNRFTGKQYNENISKDPILMKRLAQNNNTMNIDYDKNFCLDPEDLEKRGRSSLLSAIKLMLWNSNPVWLDGDSIKPDDPERTGKNKDDDHFYPYSICYKKGLYKKAPGMINNMLNIVFLPGDVNRGKGNNLLSVYIEEKKIGKEIGLKYDRQFFKSNYLPFRDIKDLKDSERDLREIFKKARKKEIKIIHSKNMISKFEDYYDDFIEKRRQSFEEGIQKLMRTGSI